MVEGQHCSEDEVKSCNKVPVHIQSRGHGVESESTWHHIEVKVKLHYMPFEQSSTLSSLYHARVSAEK